MKNSYRESELKDLQHRQTVIFKGMAQELDKYRTITKMSVCHGIHDEGICKRVDAS